MPLRWQATRPVPVFLALLLCAVFVPLLQPSRAVVPSDSPARPLSPSRSPRPKMWPPWGDMRYSAWSQSAPFAAHLASHTDYVRAVATLTAFLSSIDDAVRTLLAQRRSPASDQFLHPCNSDGTGFKNAMSMALVVRDLPPPPLSCLTQHTGTTVFASRKPSLSVEDVVNASVTFLRTVVEQRHKLMRLAAGERYFPEPDIALNFVHTTATHRCEVNNVGALRVQDTWYVLSTLTNRKVGVYLGDFQRRYIIEHHAASGNDEAPLSVLRFRMPEFDDFNKKNWMPNVLDNVTTAVSQFRGRATPHTYSHIPLAKNPAVRAAIAASDFYVQQVDDALTGSNLAVYLLPLILTAVPIALMMPVSREFTLGYIAITDLLSVVPLAVKGCELYILGRRRYQEVALRLTHEMGGAKTDSAAAELWTAECRINRPAEEIGAAFVAVACLMFVFGLCAEVFARRVLLSRHACRQRLKNSGSSDKQRLIPPECSSGDMRSWTTEWSSRFDSSYGFGFANAYPPAYTYGPATLPPPRPPPHAQSGHDPGPTPPQPAYAPAYLHPSSQQVYGPGYDPSYCTGYVSESVQWFSPAPVHVLRPPGYPTGQWHPLYNGDTANGNLLMPLAARGVDERSQAALQYTAGAPFERRRQRDSP